MSDDPSFEVDPDAVAAHLIELAARNAVLDAVMRHLTALLFSRPGSDAAFDAMREEIIRGFQFSAQTPPQTDDAVAFEMQSQAIAYARAFFDRTAAMRQEILDAGEPP